MTDVQTDGELAPRQNTSDIKIGHQGRTLLGYQGPVHYFLVSLSQQYKFTGLASRVIVAYIYNLFIYLFICLFIYLFIFILL